MPGRGAKPALNSIEPLKLPPETICRPVELVSSKSQSPDPRGTHNCWQNPAISAKCHQNEEALCSARGSVPDLVAAVLRHRRAPRQRRTHLKQIRVVLSRGPGTRAACRSSNCQET